MNSQTRRLAGLLTLAFSLWCTCANAAAGPQANPEYALGVIVKYYDPIETRGESFLPLDALASGDQQALAEAISLRTGKSFHHHNDVFNGAQVYNLADWHTAQELEAIAADIALDPAVEYAEIDRLLQPMLTPTDGLYTLQWHYFEATGGMRLPTAWDIYTGFLSVVAVIDTGVRPHTDLGYISPGYDMISNTNFSNDGDGRDNDATDPGDWVAANECGPNRPARNSTWHGTHVSGTVAARAFNDADYGDVSAVGVAFNAEIVPVRVLGKCGGTDSDISAGIVWAAGGDVSGVPMNQNPAHVMNLSLGSSNPATCSTTRSSAIEAARALGTTVVVAAGNSNANANLYTMSNCPGVISVAATNRSGGKASYSNFGTLVDVAAPGGDGGFGSFNAVLSTYNSGTMGPEFSNFQFNNGTSMAAPHVAGLIALMREGAPNMTPDQVEAVITDTARSFPSACSQCGSGIADATAALNALPPLNDNVEFATGAAHGVTNGTIAHAFVDGSTSGVGSGEPDVWFRHTAFGAGTLRVNTCGSRDLPTGLDSVLSIHSDTGVVGTATNQLALNDDFAGTGGDSLAACPNSRDSAVALAVTAGQELLIRVSRYSASSSGDFILNIALEPQIPGNDDYANTLNIVDGAISGTLFGATQDGTANGAGSTQPDVWYRYTVYGPGTLRVNTCGSQDLNGLDSVVSVHDDTGAAGNAGNQRALNDDWGSGDTSANCPGTRDSALAISADVGDVLLIRVSRYSANSDGAFILNVAFEADMPANDDHSGAQAITPGTTLGNLTGASNDGSASAGIAGQADVWFAYTAPAAGTLRVNTCGSMDLSGIDTVASVHPNDGNVGTQANQLAVNDDWSNGDASAQCPGNRDSALAMVVGPGDALLLRITRYNQNSPGGAFVLNVSFEIAPPANDDFANAITIGDGTIAGTLLGATNDGSGSEGTPNQPDVWYVYVAAAMGTLQIDTCGSEILTGLDTVLTVHGEDGNVGSPANEIAFNNDTVLCPFFSSDSGVTIPVVGGEAIFIRLTRYDGGTNGDFVLNLTFVPDSDGDGVDDLSDNCTNAFNPSQHDTDGDGYGNICDADFNNDCTANPQDLGLLRIGFFGTNAPTPNWNPDTDMNGDGVTNPVDLGLFRTRFFQRPGPSVTDTLGCYLP